MSDELPCLIVLLCFIAALCLVALWARKELRDLDDWRDD